MAKSARQDPDDCKGIIIEADDTTDNVRIGAIGTAPQTIAHHDHSSGTGYEVLRTKQPSNLRGNTQHGKVAETAIDPLGALGLTGAGHILATLEDRGHVFKYTRARLQVIQFGLGKPNVPQTYAGLVEKDSYQTIGIGVGQRAQQHGIHDAENGGVCADAEGEREHGDGGEGGTAAELAEGVAHVLPVRLEEGLPGGGADTLLGRFETAALETHGATSVLRIPALLHVFLGGHIHEAAQFFVELAFCAFFLKQGAKSGS